MIKVGKHKMADGKKKSIPEFFNDNVKSWGQTGVDFQAEALKRMDSKMTTIINALQTCGVKCELTRVFCMAMGCSESNLLTTNKTAVALKWAEAHAQKHKWVLDFLTEVQESVRAQGDQFAGLDWHSCGAYKIGKIQKDAEGQGRVLTYIHKCTGKEELL